MIPSIQFVLAGKAVFTLTDRESGKHYTYRVNKAPPPSDGTWFVGLGTGYEDSVYMGLIRFRNGGPDFMQTAKSKVGPTAPSVVLFRRFLEAVNVADEHATAFEFRHEGRCCVCARPLTNPESIDAGIGPECAGKAGG